ncbi:arabinogalactan oligomer / maltooligosaccharide transport system permease protein [Candidatus Hakubella thermalkaliphila]|uniref:Arabinogalactan oligomer / maltooligosaccharide transport system permease protein n=1 Tax=Candidatus Hakubella thermalkaliphila TaxID=2754717 RepID=A0A6V8Q448_9ACTN|nr:sugar ABC transporter permease [Candidatus Hakubella thermalkaliphila]GFP37691.1 arabinogalactan oligomer / maltooligosaccharide transport system permease protein [Candidatus Hakubella thermalkaliphila]
MRKKINPYLYLIPALLVMGVITFYPMGFQLWMSFTNYGIRNLRFDAPPPDWVGRANYVRILTTNLGLGNFSFWRVLGFNLFWAFSNVIIHVTLGIMIAVVLNTAGLWFKRIYRVIYILPIVIPQIIVANVFRNMFDPDWGAINQGLALIGSLFGLSPDLFHIRWIAQLGYPISGIPLTLSYFALLITNIWLGWPFMTIVATGALQSIPHELYGAADIDGASGLQKFWRITLPLIRPAMVPAAVYGLVVTFNLFTLIYFLSGGGPLRETEILLTVAFRLVNEQRLYGLAAAFSVYIFFVLLGLTLLTNYITRATESYEI